MKGNGRARAPTDLIFYADCPRCGRAMRTPFSRLGGPQITVHHCGHGFRPRDTQFIIVASGTGYLAYEFTPNEPWEPAFERAIGYWATTLWNTIPLTNGKQAPSFRVAG